MKHKRKTRKNVLGIIAAAAFLSIALSGCSLDEPAGQDLSDTLFARMPDTFYFLSGAGGWSTELYLEDDGSFTGEYHDSEMGDRDPQEYPNGSRYICVFSGAFTQPEKVDEYTYSVRVESLDYDEPGKERIEDGIRLITADPYGLDGAEEVRIYLPGYPVEDLSEEVLMWLSSAEPFYTGSPPETLPFYVLHNLNEQTAFFSETP